jgi:Asp-tRNA(Asn)/Glu-tRNA(Gln) amidotransferase A subunit family amidase
MESKGGIMGTAGKRVAEIVDLAPIRADLEARIAAIDVRAPYSRACDLAPDVDAIRLIAHRAGMNPAVTVAHFIDSALARGEHGPLVHGWLATLKDAIGSERQDVQACHAFAALCSVRLSGS